MKQNICERLTALRKIMKENGVQYYYITTADYHNSEYADDYFKEYTLNEYPLEKIKEYSLKYCSIFISDSRPLFFYCSFASFFRQSSSLI